MKRGYRWLVIPVLLAAVVLTPTENGRWRCSLCGKHERRYKIMFLTVGWKAEQSAYNEWFLRNINRSHKHDWNSVGCHNIGNMFWGMIACSMTKMALQEEIPSLANVDLSRKAVDKLFLLSEADRRQELRDADHCVSNPASPSYAEWWESHALWQDVFPSPVLMPQENQ